MTQYKCRVYPEVSISAAVDNLMIEIEVIDKLMPPIADGEILWLSKEDAILFAREILLLAGVDK